MTELRPVLDSLVAKGLVQFLTPEGRGAIVTHTLYQDRELDKVRREAAALGSAMESSDADPPVAVARPIASGSASPAPRAESSSEAARLREDVADLQRELTALRSEFESATEQLRGELAELNRQLGN